MTDEEEKDAALWEALERVPWPIDWGYVKIKVQDGEATVATIERSSKRQARKEHDGLHIRGYGRRDVD